VNLIAYLHLSQLFFDLSDNRFRRVFVVSEDSWGGIAAVLASAPLNPEAPRAIAATALHADEELAWIVGETFANGTLDNGGDFGIREGH
jgi:hypothetical protein